MLQKLSNSFHQFLDDDSRIEFETSGKKYDYVKSKK